MSLWLHFRWAHLKVISCLIFFLNKWAFNWPNFKPPQLHNHFNNLQAKKKKKNGMIPWMCNSQNMKINCSKNASYSKFCIFYSILILKVSQPSFEPLQWTMWKSLWHQINILVQSCTSTIMMHNSLKIKYSTHWTR